MQWEFIESTPRLAEDNMRFDEDLLLSLEDRERPLLYFHSWLKDSITYGFFENPEAFLNQTFLEKTHISIARRPTGGGVVFHSCALSFSALIPAKCPLYSTDIAANYTFINTAVQKALQAFLGSSFSSVLTPEDSFPLDQECSHFCMARPTKFDVVVGDKKIAGAAQRNKKEGFLHQGIISLVHPSQEYLNAALKKDSKIKEGILKFTYPLLNVLFGAEVSPKQFQKSKDEIQQLLKEKLIYER